MLGYPHEFPFLMCETTTGRAICVVIDGDTVRFHDSDSDPFPGPEVAAYNSTQFDVDDKTVSGFALDLSDPTTHIDGDTWGPVRGWLTDEIRSAR